MTEEHDEPREARLTISESHIDGMIAGRDINVTEVVNDDNREELVDLLEHRAEKVRKELDSHYKYEPVQKYLEEFNSLHEKHIESIKKGNFTVAHETLREIHRLSFEFEHNEFWERHEVEEPNVSYRLAPDAFDRGKLICGYVAGEVTQFSRQYPSERGSHRDYNEDRLGKHPYQILLEDANKSDQ